MSRSHRGKFNSPFPWAMLTEGFDPCLTGAHVSCFSVGGPVLVGFKGTPPGRYRFLVGFKGKPNGSLLRQFWGVHYFETNLNLIYADYSIWAGRSLRAPKDHGHLFSSC